MRQVFDPGLQPERTELAWRRTGLTLLVGSLIATRVLLQILGGWAAALGVIEVASAAGLLFAIHRAFTAQRLATDRDHPVLAGGRILGGVALYVVGVGVVALALLVCTSPRR